MFGIVHQTLACRTAKLAFFASSGILRDGLKSTWKVPPFSETKLASSEEKFKYCSWIMSEKRNKKKRKAPPIPEPEDEKRPIKKMNASKTPLPKSLLAIKNSDKDYHEKWIPGADLLDFPHPFRGVLLGPPNCGKTTTVKNILLRQTPHFERFYVIHCDGNFTQEYDDIQAKLLTRIPAPEEWPGKSKTLVVVDDLELKTLRVDQRKALDRLFGYVSTHKNISVLLCSQDPFNVPAIVRRCSNLWVLWPGKDVDAVQTCARKCGVDLRTLFAQCEEPRDSIWIDMTDHSPQTMRLNGYRQIPETSS